MQQNNRKFETRLIETLSTLSPWISNSSEIETYSTTACPPWIESRVKTHISPLSKEKEAKAHEAQYAMLKNDNRNIVCYTDGSMLKENIGAGTVVEMTGEAVMEATYPMGHQQEVYDAELLGILKAAKTCFQICQRNNLTKRHIWIFTDNQAAIQRLNTFKPGPGQSTSLALSNISNNLHALKTTITVQWVPGHTDVPGNELADKLAKKATLEKPPTYYHTSLSYLKRVTRAAKMQEWGDWWMRHPAKGKNYVGTFRTKPDQIFTSGNRQFNSTVTQLRTGHGYFRSYLYKIPTNSVDSPHCPCRYGGPQSPEHLLLRCPLYQRERQRMRKEIGVVHPRYLWKYLLYTDKAMKPLKHFLNDTHIATRRWYLGQFRDDEYLGQGNNRIAGQGTVNNEEEEHPSESGEDDEGCEEELAGVDVVG
jgi:ribonuclease HI